MTNDPEYQMIEQLKAGECSLERALLVVSGLNERGIVYYQRKLDQLQHDFEQWHTEKRSLQGGVLDIVLGRDYTAAQELHTYLWETKPDRYDENFLLADVIDNQLNEDKERKVGNCVGLTSLFSVLGLRLGFDLTVLHGKVNPTALEGHVLSFLNADQRRVIIENTKREKGFDYNLREGESYKIEDLIMLVAVSFDNRGGLKHRLGDRIGAVRDYNRAIELKPDYKRAINNRRHVLQKIQQIAERSPS